MVHASIDIHSSGCLSVLFVLEKNFKGNWIQRLIGPRMSFWVFRTHSCQGSWPPRRSFILEGCTVFVQLEHLWAEAPCPLTELPGSICGGGGGLHQFLQLTS